MSRLLEFYPCNDGSGSGFIELAKSPRRGSGSLKVEAWPRPSPLLPALLSPLEGHLPGMTFRVKQMSAACSWTTRAVSWCLFLYIYLVTIILHLIGRCYSTMCSLGVHFLVSVIDHLFRCMSLGEMYCQILSPFGYLVWSLRPSWVLTVFRHYPLFGCLACVFLFPWVVFCFIFPSPHSEFLVSCNPICHFCFYCLQLGNYIFKILPRPMAWNIFSVFFD